MATTNSNRTKSNLTNQLLNTLSIAVTETFAVRECVFLLQLTYISSSVRMFSESLDHTGWNMLLIWTALVLWYCMHSQHTRLKFTGHTKELCELLWFFWHKYLLLWLFIFQFDEDPASCKKSKSFCILCLTSLEAVMYNFFTVLCLVLLHDTVSAEFFEQNFDEIFSLHIVYVNALCFYIEYISPSCCDHKQQEIAVHLFWLPRYQRAQHCVCVCVCLKC